MMKQVILMCLFLLAMLPVSCVDTLEAETGNVPEGVPVVARFSYKVEAGRQIDTRLAQDENVEKQVSQLYAIAFDGNGVRSGGGQVAVNSNQQFSVAMKSGIQKILYLIANYDHGNAGWLEDEDGNRVSLDDIMMEDQLKRVGFRYADSDSLQVDRALFLMVGSIGGFTVNVNGTVSNASSIPLVRLSSRINFVINTQPGEYMKSLTFEPYYYTVNNIPRGTYLVERTVEEQDAPMDWHSNIPDNYAVMEGSEVRYLDKVAVNQSESSEFTFYLFENRLTPARTIETGGVNDFATLYALREKRDVGDKVESDNGQQHTQGAFTYAPRHGTYVIVHGRVSGVRSQDAHDNPGAEVYAETSFIVHLGETGNSTAQSNSGNWNRLVNNYNTYRGSNYTYRLTVTGVHSMHVEVDEGNEVRPGVEGDLVMTDQGSFFELDAHYNTTVFKVDLSDMEQTDEQGNLVPVSWAYSTPYGKGIKQLNTAAFDANGNVINEAALQTDLSVNDYKWIKFAINRECAEGVEGLSGPMEQRIIPYPGETVYDGGSADGSRKAPAIPSSALAANSQGRRLYDVNQLMNRLYQISKSGDPTGIIETGADGSRKVTITAYIDEFLYTYDPEKAYYKAPNRTNLSAEEKKLWKQGVNHVSRWLYLSTDSKLSPDGATSMAKAVVVFSQRPIYTIYNTNAVNAAWGTESMVEAVGSQPGGELPCDILADMGNYPNNSDNGWENSRYWMSANNRVLRWANYIDYSDGLSVNSTGQQEEFKLVTKMKDAGQSLQYAPLLRNRDFNGDGEVDSDEIVWYLGAINQLTGLVLGRYSVSRAQLYDEDKYASGNPITKVHIAGSTYYPTQDESNYYPIKIWGEEGGSNGSAFYEGGNHTGSDYTYRCMRNMGTVDGNTEGLTNYATASVVGTELIVNASLLEPNSLRTPFYNTVLPQRLSERDAAGNNRPSRVFSVLLTNAAGNDLIYDWSSQTDDFVSRFNYILQNEGTDASIRCPNGYRLPNHSELMLMHAFNDLGKLPGGTAGKKVFYSDIYISKASFSLSQKQPYWGNNRVGFIIANGNVALSSIDQNGGALKVRCVRDIE